MYSDDDVDYYCDYEMIGEDLQDIVQQFSSDYQVNWVQKKGNLGTVSIPCSFAPYVVNKALYDLGARISVMPQVIYKILGLNKLKPTTFSLVIADLHVKKPVGIVHDIEVRVKKLIYPTDFLILDCEVDIQSFVILGRPFLYTSRVLIYIDIVEVTFKWNDEKVVLNICIIVQQSDDKRLVAVIDMVDDEIFTVDIFIEERLGVEALAVVIMNFESDRIPDYD